MIRTLLDGNVEFSIQLSLCFGTRIVASLEKTMSTWKIRGYYIASNEALKSFGFVLDIHDIIDSTVGSARLKDLLLEALEDLLRIHLYSEYDDGEPTKRIVNLLGEQTLPCPSIRDLRSVIKSCGGEVVEPDKSGSEPIRITLVESLISEDTKHICWFIRKLMGISETVSSSYTPPDEDAVWAMFPSFKQFMEVERISPTLLPIPNLHSKTKRPMEVGTDQLPEPYAKKTRPPDFTSAPSMLMLTVVTCRDSLYVMNRNLNFLEVYKLHKSRKGSIEIRDCSYCTLPSTPATLPPEFTEVPTESSTFPSKSELKSICDQVDQSSLRNRLKKLVGNVLVPIDIATKGAAIPKRAGCPKISNEIIETLVTHCGGYAFGRGKKCKGLLVSLKGDWTTQYGTSLNTGQLLSMMKSPNHHLVPETLQASSLWASEMYNEISEREQIEEDWEDIEADMKIGRTHAKSDESEHHNSQPETDEDEAGKSAHETMKSDEDIDV